MSGIELDALNQEIMIMNPQDIQIVLQGGGAKVAPLLAGADAIMKLQKDGVVKITRIAGTSAGAIVATLIASNLDLFECSQWLANNTETRLRKMTNNVEYGNLSFVNKCVIGTKIVFSKPLGDIEVLEVLLHDLFKHLNKNMYSGDKEKPLQINIPLKIVATDLFTSTKKTFSFEQGTDVLTDILPLVVDSCALPIFFRTNTSRDGGRYIDGGIVDNFPVEELIEEVDQFGPIFGLAFDKESPTKKADSFDSYFRQLLSTAINHSVDRSISMLGNSQYHLIDTNFNTLDFTDAIKWMADEKNYETTKKETNEQVQKFLAKLASKDKEHDLSDMTDLNGILYQRLYAETERKFIRTGYHAIARCLAQKGNQNYSPYTEIREIQSFEPCGDPIKCISIATIAPSSNRASIPLISVTRSDTGDNVDFLAVPSTLKEDKNKTAVNVYFIPQLPVGKVEYILQKTSYVLDGLGQLKCNKVAHLCVGNALTNSNVRAEIVIDVPQNFPNISIRSSVGETDPSSADESQLIFLEDNPKVRKMSQSELAEYGANGGLQRLGWCEPELKAGEYFILELQVSPVV